MMKVIITGGTGLMGHGLSSLLVSKGYEVIVLSRSPQRAAGLPTGVRVERWDGRSADGWGQLVEGATAIVNLAGANLAGTGFFPSRWTAQHKHRIRESRVQSGRVVVEAVQGARDKPRVVIQASAVGYYGFGRDEIFTEDCPAGDDFLARLTADDWEPSTAAVEDMGVRRVIVRSGVVLSTELGALPRLLLPYRLFVGGPIGSGKQWLAWIHPYDLSEAIRFLIENEEASGPFNLTAPVPKTNAEFGRTMGRILGRPSLVPLPGFALRLALGEVSSVVLEGQRVLPKNLQDMGFEFRFPDADSALRDLLE
ncbi:MAG: TIGR01777 family oxidoreductase [Candidatus Aminicenantaceae bacterium]